MDFGCYSFKTTFSNENREVPFIVPQEVGFVSLHSFPVFVSHSGDYVKIPYTDTKAKLWLACCFITEMQALSTYSVFSEQPNN